jgi:peptide/nickel transport system ATP-binding protein
MTAPLLEIRDVARRFNVRRGLFAPRQTLTAVAGVSLTLPRGEVLGLVGESGCGKSTLARIVLGLDRPSEGEVLVAGKPVAGLHRLERARLVQPVFQDPYSSLNPRRTVEAIIGQPLFVHGEGTAAERRDRVAEMLGLVGLGARHAAAYPSQLSGGQRQRVAIARALILRPALVVCDEPTSALDVSVQAQILNLLMELQSRLGLSYLFISHNLAVVQLVATRVAVMYLGRVVEEGAPDVVLGAPLHPYTRALLASVLPPRPGRGLPEAGLTGAFPNPLNPPPGCAFHPRCPLAAPRCSVEPPALVAHEGGHLAACHFAGAEAPGRSP